MTFQKAGCSRCSMTIFMFNVICVTNRHLCRGDFLTQLERVLQSKPFAVILREKDLSQDAYRVLAEAVMELCEQYNVLCIFHNFYDAKAMALHLPLPMLRSLTPQERASVEVLGSSCHSVEEAMEAQRLGCTYIMAGHVFATACKKNLEPRGVEFLKDICDAVDIPIYGIGGIGPENIHELKGSGIDGVCIMSGWMECQEPEEYMNELKKGWTR